jgi:hypothetical protein
MRAAFFPLLIVAGLGVLQDTHVAPAVALQPLAQTVRRLESAMAYLGQPLPNADHAMVTEDQVTAAQSARAISDVVDAVRTGHPLTARAR